MDISNAELVLLDAEIPDSKQVFLYATVAKASGMAEGIFSTTNEYNEIFKKRQRKHGFILRKSKAPGRKNISEADVIDDAKIKSRMKELENLAKTLEIAPKKNSPKNVENEKSWLSRIFGW
ncbi:hypothetical protein SteCoe_30376 [Stentor coeruleus]|uniref:Uncharacterized protein n=1 Tax=Stentor coeruleus TaxID=5963 RepID=A0A1R2B3U4_9CILI|nr:hypothetical protein SteCoe_30376 [Stentor coeruleus]